MVMFEKTQLGDDWSVDAIVEAFVDESAASGRKMRLEKKKDCEPRACTGRI